MKAPQISSCVAEILMLSSQDRRHHRKKRWYNPNPKGQRNRTNETTARSGGIALNLKGNRNKTNETTARSGGTTLKYNA